MRSLLFVSVLLGLGAAAPQRGIGGCGCREVICPNQGPDHCACINAAAEDCSRYQRGDCPQPPRCNDNGRPNGNPNNGPPRNGGNGPFNTIYTTMPITYTVTTTLPGFYSPRPVTSYSTIVSMVTVTLSGPPPNGGWNGPQTIWQTTTVNGIPPWASRSTTPTRQNPPPTTYIPRTTSTRIPPKSTNPPWSVPPPPPTTYTPPPPVQTTSWRPTPWTPSSNPGGNWTPISTGMVPTAIPTSAASPSPPPIPSATSGPPIPTDMGQPPPVAGAPQKCGPGAAKCPDGTYCDPQPLCSIGEDCAGVCLPTFSTKFTDFSQPWEVRRNIWQNLLNSGNYSIYRFNGDK